MRAPVPDLRGKRCFITGAASGIGRATALAAARRGADLYLTDIPPRGWSRPLRRSRRRRPGQLRARRRCLRPRCGRRDGGGDPRRPRQHGRGDEHRRDLDLGVDRAPRARALAADDRDQPDGPDQRDRVLRAADDRGRPRRPRRQRLLCRRGSSASPGTPPTAPPSSASAASPRCCASTCDAHGIGVSLVCPGGGADAARRDASRSSASTATTPDPQAESAASRSAPSAPSTSPRRSSRASRRTATWSSARADIRVGYWVQRKFPPAYELAMRKLNDQPRPSPGAAERPSPAAQ